MGRRLAEATKACLARSTRGEIGLRFFLGLLEETVFFLAGAVFDVDVADFDVVLAVALLLEVLLAGGWLEVVGESDWATAGEKKPSVGRKKNPTKTATAKCRTQTLPTAGSWHP